jgi:hypothetical protein
VRKPRSSKKKEDEVDINTVELTPADYWIGPSNDISMPRTIPSPSLVPKETWSPKEARDRCIKLIDQVLSRHMSHTCNMW